MGYIVAYQKASGAFISCALSTPEGSTELCTLDGVTYTALPDSAVLPDQPEQIAGSMRIVTPDIELRAHICAVSPHVAMIRARVAAQIAERYSITDEIRLLRTAPSPEFEMYNAYVEECRQWGRQRKAELGL